MKRLLSIAAAMCVVACRTVDHTAIADGSYHYEHDLIKQVGGTSHFTGADGMSDTADLNASLKQTLQMATSLGLGAIGLLTVKAQELTKRLASHDLALTDRAKIQADLATTLKQLDTQLAAQGLTNQANHFQTAVNAGLFTSVPLPTR